MSVPIMPHESEFFYEQNFSHTTMYNIHFYGYIYSIFNLF